MSDFTNEERNVLKSFFDTFEVRATSLATQALQINPDRGTTIYNDTHVYSDTIDLEILYNGECVHTVSESVDDVEAILKYALKWSSAGKPLPDKDNINFFNYLRR